MVFENRVEAGRKLAEHLKHLRDEDVVVLGLPRGGVPVAREVAKNIHAPLDIIVVRKIGVPTQPELAMGAIGEGDVIVVNRDILKMIQIQHEDFDRIQARESLEVRARAMRFRGDRPRISLVDKIALIVDDGIATGSTAQAACKVARALGAKKVLLAVPVGSAEAVNMLSKDADEIICLEIPSDFVAVGEWYRNFTPVDDQEVIRILQENESSVDKGV